ncbi:MAG: response regulator transcription factor [Clostridia bacterium]|nr:response regulator transcription factor [Clostridia bacterium]
MINILLVEDEKEINDLIASYLTTEGYCVEKCHNGLEALDKYQSKTFNLIISDIMMPNLDGFALAERIRGVDSKTPIIFLTAKDDKLSKQYGYKLGIDDYITKPFDIDELVMKIKAILRRVDISANNKLEIENLTLDKEEHSAYLNGEELNLTVREFDLLFKLLSYPKKTFTRSQLMEEFWDYDSSATSRTVDVYMAKLRDKTSKCTGFEIVTVHGLGYKVVLNEKK